MKRVWGHARIVETDAGYGIALDGKPVRTPGGAALLVPRPAAHAIVAEWVEAGGGAKGGEYTPDHLPLTRMAATAIDRIAPDPLAAAAGIARYGETDLLCYRAEHPAALVARQASLWQPHIDWAALAFDAPLRVTQGVMPLAQDEAALRALHLVVARFDALALAGVGLAVGALGSLVLGLALAHGRLDAQAATEASLVDEAFQAAEWGEDAEAAHRRARIAHDVALAARWLALVRESAPGLSGDGPKALRAIVTGHVQGVGYRAWTVRQARKLGVSGWVRNRADGSVELLVAGDPSLVEALLSACRRGPPSSRVDGIETHAAEAPDRVGFAQAATV